MNRSRNFGYALILFIPKGTCASVQRGTSLFAEKVLPGMKNRAPF